MFCEKGKSDCFESATFNKHRSGSNHGRTIIASSFSLLLLLPVLFSTTSCTEVIQPNAEDHEVKSADFGTTVSFAAPEKTTAWQGADRILFLHRSVGFALIRNGAVDMYDVLDRLNSKHNTDVRMWHHGCGSNPYWNRYYDGDNLQVIPNFGSAMSEPQYANPEHWKKIFCDPDSQYIAARDSIDNFRVIIFKSGYDNTVPYATDKAEQWRQFYRTMKDSEIFTDPTKRIIVLGFVPMRGGIGHATQADADSSRAFNQWLVQEFVLDRDNLFSFPLFDQLAGPDNWLKDEYERVENPSDSHPNAYGCEIVGGELMKFMYSVARFNGEPVHVDVQRHTIPVE